MMTLRSHALKSFYRSGGLGRSCTARSFFASSTDHTLLLKNATVHRVNITGDENPYGKRQYILIPLGTDIKLALRVDKLHLARLSVDDNVIFGAKVVQRTLGPSSIVCSKLLQRALEDIKSQGKVPVALASLEGLSRWVMKGLEGEEKIGALKNMDVKSFDAIKAIATQIPRLGHSVVGQGTYNEGSDGWKNLAEEYINVGLSQEGNLYSSHGFRFEGIDLLVDTSREGIVDAGGAMARYTFES